MAVTIKAPVGKKAVTNLQRAEVVNIPSEKSGDIPDISQLLILLYGVPKIGKTTFASEFPDPLFLKTQEGDKFLKTRGITVKSWAHFLAIVGELGTGKHECGNIVIDVVDDLYRMCMEHVCAIAKIDHPSDDKGYGRVWDKISDAFFDGVRKVCTLGVGVIFIGHSVEKEVVSRSMTISKLMPSMKGGCYKIINSIVDMTLCATFDHQVIDGKSTERRVIRTKPQENMDAGDRSGSLPAVIPLDYEAFEEAYITGMKAKI